MHSIKALDLSILILVYRTMPKGRRRGRGRGGQPRLREIERGVAVEGPPREGSEAGSVTVTVTPKTKRGGGGQSQLRGKNVILPLQL